MPDIEKVIKGLDVCLKNIDQPDCPNDCPYLSDCSKYENRVVFQPLMRDALTMLKEQEAVSIKCIAKRTLVDDSYDEPVYSNNRFYDCPHCGQRLSRTYPNKDIKYCWKCGNAVKWE